MPAVAQVSFRRVILSDDPVPGVPHASFFAFGQPTINSGGLVAFAGDVVGDDIISFVNDTGVWSEGTAPGVELVTRAGEDGPGLRPAAAFEFFSTVTLNDVGESLFTANACFGNDTIYASLAGVLRAVALPNAPIGTSGLTFFSIFGAAFNPTSQAAMQVVIDGPGANQFDDEVVLVESAGQYQIVAHLGDPAPGVGTDVWRDLRPPVINAAGRVAFFGDVGAQESRVVRRGIWIDRGNGLVPAAIAGGPAGIQNVTFNSFSDVFDPNLNNQGHTAFRAIASTGAEGIWVERGNGPELVAIANTTAPGASPARFGAFDRPVLDGQGRAAFSAQLNNAQFNNNRGIWKQAADGTLQLIARTGDPAPGMSAIFFGVTSPIVNGAGQIAFIADAFDQTSNDSFRGLWATDATGDLRLVIREGVAVDVDLGPGTDVRTVSFISVLFEGNGEDGQRTSMNASGTVAITLDFNDGSAGVFKATLQASDTTPPGLTSVSSRKVHQ